MIMIESNDITSSKQALLSLHGTDPEYCTQNARFVLEGLLTVPHLHETQFLHADPLVCQETYCTSTHHNNDNNDNNC
jgi:hypothetical protein